MNKTISHTPTPWEVGGPYPGTSVIYCTDPGDYGPEPTPPDYDSIAILDQRTEGVPDPVARANAALIVRAVNEREALVTALERLTGSMLLHEGRDIAGRDLGTWDAEALIAARAALKLARGDA